MNRKIERILGLGLGLCLCLGLAGCGQAKQSEEEPAVEETQVTAEADAEEVTEEAPEEAAEEAPAEASAEAAGEASAEAGTDEYLASLQGTYEELFPAMDLEENKETWYQDFEAVLGVEDEETAETLRQMIIGMFTTDAYGEEAVALAEQDPTYGSFDCYFIDGVSTLTFEGNTITGYDADGAEVFSHTYTKIADEKIDFGAMTDMYSAYLTEETWPTMAIYESDGEDDNFKYFAFCGDSPDETFHIEFRYGPTMEGITSYFDGDYAYWLAAGFLQDAPDGMMEDCINLFVTENADSFAAYLGSDSAAE